MCMQTCCSNCCYLLIVRIIKGTKKSGHNHCPSMRVRCTCPQGANSSLRCAPRGGHQQSRRRPCCGWSVVLGGGRLVRPGSELPSSGPLLMRAGVERGMLPRRGSTSREGEILRKPEVAGAGEADLYVYRTIKWPRCSCR